MFICKTRHSILFKAITLAVACLFLINDIAWAKSDALAVAPAGLRDTAQEARAMAYRRLFDQKLAPVLGGKGAFDYLLEDLAAKIRFHTADSTRFTIQEIWGAFIAANKKLVDEGNAFIEAEKSKHGKLNGDAEERLRSIAAEFRLSKELEFYIRSRTAMLKGWVIMRSSGRHEDSFLRNLAGIFISPKRRDERLVVQGIKEIFADAINTIWVSQNNESNKTDGLADRLTAEDGIGVVVQPFIQFDASGTAMTNLYGHTSIQAVIGDADMAVRPVYATTCQFLFKKGQRARKPSFEYNPSFARLPYEFRLKGRLYSATNDPESAEAMMRSYPKIGGIFSPINEKAARELYRVISALEDEIGVPLDVEWGFLDGKLYIIQIRPIIGDFKKPLVEMDKSLQDKTPIARTPIALGATSPKGFTGKVVVVGSGIKPEQVEDFENTFGREYIRVEYDVASAVLSRTTKAKVLVDPVQGSREAHNINQSYGRIAGGEFIYANGPILRDGLMHNLNLIPHPTMKGFWVSQEDVTYFCDGLRAQFFIADTPAVIYRKTCQQ